MSKFTALVGTINTLAQSRGGCSILLLLPDGQISLLRPAREGKKHLLSLLFQIEPKTIRVWHCSVYRDPDCNNVVQVNTTLVLVL